ncbi:hypothetical protein KIL84_019554, partial [Mauremys mutica]
KNFLPDIFINLNVYRAAVALPDSETDGSFGDSLKEHCPILDVNEEELKKRVTEELALEQARRETEAQKRLKQDQKYIRDEIGKVLERERTASNEHLTRAVLRERAATEEERLKTQHFAKQLEEKDRELKKHDAYYKEQLARLEERSAQFYKVTTEQYQQAVKEVEAKFKDQPELLLEPMEEKELDPAVLAVLLDISSSSFGITINGNCCCDTVGILALLLRVPQRRTGNCGGPTF